mmetsp:Transcript_7486/g.11526  ORF Transcript_7486/g.11526 Transcript_7486/m.11526 type:complete len:203 (-) Transcript_7486:902-1510(-)
MKQEIEEPDVSMHVALFMKISKSIQNKAEVAHWKRSIPLLLVLVLLEKATNHNLEVFPELEVLRIFVNKMANQLGVCVASVAHRRFGSQSVVVRFAEDQHSSNAMYGCYRAHFRLQTKTVEISILFQTSNTFAQSCCNCRKTTTCMPFKQQRLSIICGTSSQLVFRIICHSTGNHAERSKIHFIKVDPMSLDDYNRRVIDAH